MKKALQVHVRVYVERDAEPTGEFQAALPGRGPPRQASTASS
jgi:hypothetical protein